MAQTLLDGTFACTICGTKYYSSAHADACRDSHEYIYVPMSKSELNLLMNALMMGDTSLVPEHLYLTLQKYARFQVTNGEQDKMS